MPLLLLLLLQLHQETRVREEELSLSHRADLWSQVDLFMQSHGTGLGLVFVFLTQVHH